MTRIGHHSRIDRLVRRWCIGAIVVSLTHLSLATAYVQAQPQPIYTRQPNFRIPFQFDAEEMTRIGAVEVQLHVSTDQGATWKLMQTVNPGAQKFQFNAPINGEYRFSVRTIDLQRRPHPAGAFESGLIVVVDDLPPLLTLDATPIAGGQLQVQWQATDEHLDIDTLRVEYLDSQIAAWQPLPVNATAFGRTNWQPPAGQGQVMLRAFVSDRSGNQASADAKAAVTGPAETGRSTQPDGTLHRDVPDFREPVAQSNPYRRTATDTLPSIRPSSTDTRAPLPLHAASSGEAGAMRPATLPSAVPVQIPTLPNPNTPTGPVPTPALALLGDGTSSSATSTAIRPDLGIQTTVPNGNDPAVSVDQRSPLLRVNSHSFRLSYEIEDVGTSGVESVDIYITENGGRKWYHYQQDPDQQSPVEITVPADGEYGFAVRVRNGVGLVADPPQSHNPNRERPFDVPEIRVIVDRTPPVAELLPLQQQVTAAGSQVLISWKVSDDSLASRPVSLSIGNSSTGPWESITGWIENSGMYAWPIKNPAPERLYVRLVARDQAGNTTEVVSSRPATIDLSRPRARFLDAQPIR